jgi:hypothetical protein
MIDGTGLGYLERPVLGHRTLQQYGSMPGFSGFLMLMPEKNFGMFIAANSPALDFGDELSKSVIERLFPASPDRTPVDLTRTVAYRPDIEGFYRSNRISRETAEKISKMASNQIEITMEKGYITSSNTRGKIPPTRWLPVSGEDDVFRKVGDDGYYENEYMFFQRNPDGAVTAMVEGGVSRTFDKLEPYESYYWNWAIISGFVATAALTFLGLFIGNAVNKGKFPWEKGLSSDTELWGISSIFCVAQLSFVAGLAIAKFYVGNEFKLFVPYQVKALFVVPLAGGLLLAWFWFRAFAKILNPDYHWLEKTVIIAIAFIETGYMLFLANWRLLGFMF